MYKRQIQDILKFVHAKGQGSGPKDEVGQVLYTRCLLYTTQVFGLPIESAVSKYLFCLAALALNTSGQDPKVIQDILKFVHAKGQGCLLYTSRCV